jgi:peroxiredoxin
MKNMKKIYEKYSSKGLQMLSISTDDNKTQSQIPVIIRNYKLPFTVLLDPDKNIYKLFNVANVPELFIIDKTGKIIYRHQGYQKGDELKTEEIVASILAKDK